MQLRQFRNVIELLVKTYDSQRQYPVVLVLENLNWDVSGFQDQFCDNEKIMPLTKIVIP